MVWLLSACQSGQGAAGADAVSPNPLSVAPIEVTSLDPPESAAAPGVQPAVEDQAPLAPVDAAPTEAAAPQPEAPQPEAPSDTAGEQTPSKPVVPKSPAQIACERQNGVWSPAGSGAASFCQKITRDGGKSCRASSDCEGYCLARSMTCAPVTPMFGCQEILNEYGRMLTQCID